MNPTAMAFLQILLCTLSNWSVKLPNSFTWPTWYDSGRLIPFAYEVYQQIILGNNNIVGRELLFLDNQHTQGKIIDHSIQNFYLNSLSMLHMKRDVTRVLNELWKGKLVVYIYWTNYSLQHNKMHKVRKLKIFCSTLGQF